MCRGMREGCSGEDAPGQVGQKRGREGGERWETLYRDLAGPFTPCLDFGSCSLGPTDRLGLGNNVVDLCLGDTTLQQFREGTEEG